VLAILAAALLWGTTGTAASFLPADVPPVATGAATMAIGGLLLFAVTPRLSWAALRSRATRGWLLAGGACVVAYPLAFYSSMSLAGVAVGNVVSLGSAPVFAAVLERVVEGHRLRAAWWITTCLALSGVVLLGTAGPAHSGARGPGTPEDAALGLLLGLVAGASYAGYTYCSRRAMERGCGSRAAMGAVFGVGAVLLLPVLLATGAPLAQSGGSLAITGYLALGPMFLAYLLFGAGLRSVASSAATTLTLLEPVVATLLAVTVVGERLAPLGWAGMALIGLALALLTARGATSGARRRGRGRTDVGSSSPGEEKPLPADTAPR
jgi:DME family drug/metabolite transporter